MKALLGVMSGILSEMELREIGMIKVEKMKKAVEEKKGIREAQNRNASPGQGPTTSIFLAQTSLLQPSNFGVAGTQLPIRHRLLYPCFPYLKDESQ